MRQVLHDALSGKAAPPDTKTFTQLKFTFPPLELRPGEIVVVFNGHFQRTSVSGGFKTRPTSWER